MKRRKLDTSKAPSAIGPYVQGVEAAVNETQKLVFLSGQLGLNPEAGTLEEGIEAQTSRAMSNIGAVLSEGGMDYSNIVKTTIFLKSLDDFGVMNKIYESYFPAEFPARSCVQAAALPRNALIEIEAIAIG